MGACSDCKWGEAVLNKQALFHKAWALENVSQSGVAEAGGTVRSQEPGARAPGRGDRAGRPSSGDRQDFEGQKVQAWGRRGRGGHRPPPPKDGGHGEEFTLDLQGDEGLRVCGSACLASRGRTGWRVE